MPNCTLRVRGAAHSLSICCCLIGGMLVATGCGSNARGLVPVGGRVTVDGEPVTEGRVQFFADSGRPAVGTIGTDGRYQLKTYEPGDGAKPGKYRVTITSRIAPADEGPRYNSLEDELRGNVAGYGSSQDAGRRSSRTTWLVPKKYSNRASSDLEAVVNSVGEDIDFQLQTNP